MFALRVATTDTFATDTFADGSHQHNCWGMPDVREDVRA